MNLFIFEHTTSTNDLGRSSSFSHGDVIWAYEQSAGRGQRGNKWVDEFGNNLTFSIILQPTEVAANEQFVISQITALALRETLSSFGIEAQIKWTNDIYVGDYKVAGVLIENSLQDGVVSRSIIGVGLNVNQLEFNPSLPNPTSMRRCTGLRYDREEVLRRFHERLTQRYADLVADSDSDSAQREISAEYHSALYRLGEEHTYQLASGDHIRATIEGVCSQGELRLRHSGGDVCDYLFREVAFIIETRDK